MPAGKGLCRIYSTKVDRSKVRTFYINLDMKNDLLFPITLYRMLDFLCENYICCQIISNTHLQYPCSILCLSVVLIETGFDQHNYFIFIPSIINQFTLCILQNNKIMNNIVFLIIYLICWIKLWMVSVYVRNRQNQYTLYQNRNFINTYILYTKQNIYSYIY